MTRISTKGIERTKGAWWGEGNAGRKSRRTVERRIRRAAKRAGLRLENAFTPVDNFTCVDPGRYGL